MYWIRYALSPTNVLSRYVLSPRFLCTALLMYSAPYVQRSYAQ
jgi:hypothetical protein